jgi:hypothetical protein
MFYDSAVALLMFFFMWVREKTEICLLWHKCCLLIMISDENISKSYVVHFHLFSLIIGQLASVEKS